MREMSGESDSRRRFGGRIHGTPGIHAFYQTGPEPSAIPVLISVPHAGRAYSGNLLSAMRNPESVALKLEDRFADRLGHAIAAATGAKLLVANAPRAMIDLNRAPDDIDWDMFGRGERPDVGSYSPSRRARSGLGLIPRRVPGIGELWNRRHLEAELAARLADIHEPYHASLSETLRELRRRWGAAVLLDLHSMPSIHHPAGQRSPDFVLGDRFGASCHGGLMAASFSYFHEMDRVAAHNRPYSGGYVLERHAAPECGVHAIQLEIDRGAYLDARLAEPGEGFAATVQLLAGLVRRLAAESTLLGENGGDAPWSEAAE